MRTNDGSPLADKSISRSPGGAKRRNTQPGVEMIPPDADCSKKLSEREEMAHLGREMVCRHFFDDFEQLKRNEVACANTKSKRKTTYCLIDYYSKKHAPDIILALFNYGQLK